MPRPEITEQEIAHPWAWWLRLHLRHLAVAATTALAAVVCGHAVDGAAPGGARLELARAGDGWQQGEAALARGQSWSLEEARGDVRN